MRIAVIADVIDSRKYAYAAGIPEKLISLNALLREKGLGAVCPFTCMRGDEIEAVYGLDARFLCALRHLRHALHPLKLRIGVGIGTLLIPDGVQNPFETNGEAFYLARDAVETLRKKNKAMQNALLIQKERAPKTLPLLCALYSHLLSGVTGRQWEAVFAYKEQGGMEKAARYLSKPKQSVQRTLTRVRIDLITDCEDFFYESIRMAAESTEIG